MARFFLTGSAVAGALLVASAALAQQGGPLQLGPPTTPPAPPSRAGQPASTAPTVAPAPETPQILIQRINQSLNATTTMVSDFTQTNADGRRRTGRLYLQRPGRLRFDYNPPAMIEVVADGTSVAVIDKKVPQQDVYGIGQTPLKFLLADRIDVSRDTKVNSVKREKDDVILEIEDRNTLAGTSRIRIYFAGDTFQVRRWTVTDPQGIPTTVALANISSPPRMDRQLFFINYQFNQNRTNN